MMNALEKKPFIASTKGEKAMRRRICFTLVIVILIWVNCTSVPEGDKVRWITIEDIARSLESQPPMNVGLDVDDTVLFSSPGYYYGMQKYSPGSVAFLEMEEFWNEMNNGLDKFSLPKDCARRLIELHKKRGDSIYFITGRQKTETETVTDLLAKIFDLADPHDVIFTGFKSVAIREKGIQIYYGDSDSDIKAAIEVGIRPIRIMRAGNSTHRPYPKYGNQGEEVLVDSEY